MSKSDKKRVIVDSDDDDDSEVIVKSIKKENKKKGSEKKKKLTKKEKNVKVYDKVKKMIFDFAHDDPSDESWEELLPKLKKEFKKAESKEKPKKKKDPNAPKRGSNPYIQYGIEMRPKLKKKFPDMKPKEIMKEISTKWAEIKDTKKAEKYKELANEDKKRYEKEMEEYTPTPGYEKKEKAQKRATTAYHLWCKDERPNMEKKFPDLKYIDIRRKMGEKWKKLSDEKKEPYEEIANKEKIKLKKSNEKLPKKGNKKEESESSESEDSEESGSSESDSDE